MIASDHIDATEFAAVLPSSGEPGELIILARIGAAFKAQQRGRRPGFLHQFLIDLVKRMPHPVTFEKLIEELELEAARRNLHGEEGRPIESVNRIWELVTYHHPRKGEQQICFKTLRNKFTSCKKTLIPD